MATHHVDLPNAAGKLEVQEPGALSGMQVTLDGRPLSRPGLFAKTYPVPARDGGVIEVAVTPDTFRGGVRVQAPGYDASFGEKIPILLAALAFLPFALVAVGGALGGLLGGLGWGVNRAISVQAFPMPLRALAMLVVSGGVFVLWLVVASALSLALH